MKKHLLLLLIFVSSTVIAQDKPATEKSKDTIKTEVVEVISSYAPKVTDAFKIKKKPIVELSENTKKKKLKYSILSVPVASTFQPKKGKVKKLEIQERDRIFKNYIAVGFGNYTSPYLETNIKNIDMNNEIGLYGKFTMAIDPVKNTQLSSSYYNAKANAYIKQEDHFFDWIVGLDVEQSKHNWYGLSNTINYQPNIIEAINEEQALGFYKLYGNLLFIDSFFTNTELSVSFLHDRFESNEINIELDANFSFPIDKLIWNANDLKLGFNTNYYATSFKNEYNKIGKSDFGFLTAQLHPSYQFDYKNFNIYAGVKGTFLMDSKRNKNYFLVYPDVKISYALQKDKTNIYAGVTGELAHHSYKSLTDENPFLSPTLNLHPTNNPYNAFAGLKGNFNKTVNYNIKGSYAYEQSKPLFITNNSKSDGTTIGPVDSENDYFGYEYGNSHQVIYDNIKTISVFSELEYQAFKEFIIGISATYNKYTLKYEQHPWHLPTIKGELFGKYKQKKWHASANIYYVGERKGVTYSGIYTTRPSSYQPINLKGYFDVNIGATYHFNPILSAFVKGKNLTNGSYQQYHNFNSQGFQIVGGIIWKFDSLF